MHDVLNEAVGQWLANSGQPGQRGVVVAPLDIAQVAAVLSSIAQLAATGHARGLVREAAAMARRRIREADGLPELTPFRRRLAWPANVDNGHGNTQLAG